MRAPGLHPPQNHPLVGRVPSPGRGWQGHNENCYHAGLTLVSVAGIRLKVQELLSPQLNVSYVEARERPPAGLVLKHYLASAVVYGGLLGFLWVNPWFKGLLSVSVDGFSAMQLYCRLYLIYLGAALPIYLWLRPRSLWGSKNLLILGCLRRAVQTAWQRLRGRIAVEGLLRPTQP